MEPFPPRTVILAQDRHPRVAYALPLILSLFVIGCGSSDDIGDLTKDTEDTTIVVPDVGPSDLSADAAADFTSTDTRPDVPLQKTPIQTLTSGSQTMSSTNFTLRLSVGLPAPMGQSQSTNFKLKLGPEAVR